MKELTLEQEQGLLGSVIRGERKLETLAGLKIHDPRHQKILLCMTMLDSLDERIDLITLAAKLHQNEMLEDVGGTYYLANLSEFCEEKKKPPPVTLGPKTNKIKAKPYM